MRTLFASLLLAASLCAGAQIGQNFPTPVLPDQYDNFHQIGGDDQRVIVSFEKDISGAINDYLKTKPKGFLFDKRTKYVSDISPMPTVITNMFALPKMRDYDYPVLLIYDEKGAKLDKRDGQITVYGIDNGVVTSIDYITPAGLPKLFGE